MASPPAMENFTSRCPCKEIPVRASLTGIFTLYFVIIKLLLYYNPLITKNKLLQQII